MSAVLKKMPARGKVCLHSTTRQGRPENVPAVLSAFQAYFYA